MDHDKYLFFVLSITIAMGLLFAACTVPGSEPTFTIPSPTVTLEAPKNTPRPSLTPTPELTSSQSTAEIAPLRLRIEYILTSDWGTLEITGMEDAQLLQIVEVAGAAYEVAEPDFFRLGRPVEMISEEPEASLVVELTLPPKEARVLEFTSKHGAIFGSFISIYMLHDAGDPVLIQQFDHRMMDIENPDEPTAVFTLDLTSLASDPQSAHLITLTPITDVILHIEYSLTSDWGEIHIDGMGNPLQIQVLESVGSMNVVTAPDLIEFERDPDAEQANWVVEAILTSDASDRLTFTSIHSGSGGAFTKVYLQHGNDDPVLLYEFDHPWEDPNSYFKMNNVFSVDLNASQPTSTPQSGPPQATEYLPHTGVERLVWATYYTWYMEYSCPRCWESDIWTDRPIDPYSSDDVSGMRAHIAQAQSAGIDGFAVEWCGVQFPMTRIQFDANLGKLLDLAVEMDFKIAVYHDLLCNDGLILQDLSYLLTERAIHPGYYHMNGLPVVFFFTTSNVDIEDWPQILDAYREQGLDAIYVGDSLNPSEFAVFDGQHMYFNLDIANLSRDYDAIEAASELYSATNEYGRPRFWAATVSPGFDNTPLYNGRNVLADPNMTMSDIIIWARAGGQTYRDQWELALQSGADWIMITSWNEWQENTHIEPSVMHGTQYLDMTRGYVERWKNEIDQE